MRKLYSGQEKNRKSQKQKKLKFRVFLLYCSTRGWRFLSFSFFICRFGPSKKETGLVLVAGYVSRSLSLAGPSFGTGER